MQSQLSAHQCITDTLRAQTHEFTNQLHTISGLVQLEEYDEVVAASVGATAPARRDHRRRVTARVDDPSVAALLIAKASVAAERGVACALDDDAALPRLRPGRLRRRRHGARQPRRQRRRRGRRRPAARTVAVQLAPRTATVVRGRRSPTTAPGVPEERATRSSCAASPPSPATPSGRGVGLALVQLVCERRGGVGVGAQRRRRRLHRPAAPVPTEESAMTRRPDRARRRRRLHGGRASTPGSSSAPRASAVVGRRRHRRGRAGEIERLRPDLVLLDVHLPDLSGHRGARRAAGRAATSPAWSMVTAAREAETVRAALPAGRRTTSSSRSSTTTCAARLERVPQAAHAALASAAPAARTTSTPCFAPAVGRGDAAVLPKGLSPQTADAVLGALARRPGSSPPPSAPTRSGSRGSRARRYLEHFVAAGRRSCA